MKPIVSFFLFTGSQKVLDGDIDGAQLFASAACNLGGCIELILSMELTSPQTKATPDLTTKTVELLQCDEHALVKYLRKSIPCNCLDEKYKQVNSTTKMGLCRNPMCSLPDRIVGRSSMLYCTRCRSVNYCSSACQKADWSEHKGECNKLVDSNTKFDSRK